MTWPILLGVGFWPVAAATSATASATRTVRAGFVEGLGGTSSMDHDLGGFGGGQLGTVTVVKLLDGVAALLDHGGQGLLLLGGGQLLALAMD